MARRKKTDLLRGTLDLMVLQVLDLQPLHGIAIADRLRQITKGTFDVAAGSLFPALHRLEQGGWIEGAWTIDNGRRIRSYALTGAGRAQLVSERKLWERIVAAVGQVINATAK
jgi:PadR family transcriptional regulator PadR